MQCERKPITQPTKDTSNDVSGECQPRGASLSPTRHSSHPLHQEKQEFEPLTPSSPRSVSSPLRCSPVSSSVGCSADPFDAILSSENIQFKLNPPTLGISTGSMEYVYEIATRLLFLTVDWTRNIQAFRTLETSDQLVLLQSSWSDLFMLGVAQCSSSFPLSPLLTLAAVHMEHKEGNEEQKSNGIMQDSNLLDKMMSIKELLFSLERLEMDLVEFAFLKSIVLFNPGNVVSSSVLIVRYSHVFYWYFIWRNWKCPRHCAFTGFEAVEFVMPRCLSFRSLNYFKLVAVGANDLEWISS